jgi:hypothetical protein
MSKLPDPKSEALRSLNAAIKEVEKARGRRQAVELLARFGVERTPDLTPEQYPTVTEAARRLLLPEGNA